MNKYASSSSANNPLMQMCGLMSRETPSRFSSVASNEFAWSSTIAIYLIHNKILLHQELLLVRTTIIRLDSKEKYLHKTNVI